MPLIDCLVELHDAEVGPTFLNIAGEVPEEVHDRRDLLPLVLCLQWYCQSLGDRLGDASDGDHCDVDRLLDTRIAERR